MFDSFADVPAWNWALQFVGVVTSYIGAEINARMKVTGFYLWMFSNVVLAVLHAATGLWLLLVLDILYLRVNTVGVLRWARAYPEQTPAWLARWLKLRSAST